MKRFRAAAVLSRLLRSLSGRAGRMARGSAERLYHFIVGRTIEGRILVGYITLACLGFAVLGTLLSYQVEGHLHQRLEQELERKARRINFFLTNGSVDWNTEQGREAARTLLDFLGRSLDVQIRVFDPSGAILASSHAEELKPGKPVEPEDVEKVLAGGTVAREISDGLDGPARLIMAPMGTAEQVTGGLIVSAALGPVHAVIGEIRQTILWSSLGVIALAVAVGLYLARSIAWPVEALSRRLARLARGDYEDEPFPLHGEHELGRLAQGLQDLAERLQRAELERQRLDESRDRLFHDISHELRTPLTAVLGFIEALRDDIPGDSEARQRYLEIIHAEASYLSRLIDNLLDLNRLDAEAEIPVRVACDLVPLLSHLIDKFLPSAALRGNELTLQGVEGPATVWGDPERLEQIFSNLIQNALQYTEQGQIRLQLRLEGAQAVVQVADTGSGIPPEEIDRIWERFYRGSTGRASARGSGLGLAIVRRLVELHQGEISVSSQPGSGTVFTVRLPRVEFPVLAQSGAAGA